MQITIYFRMCTLELSRMIFAFRFTFNVYRFGVVANRLSSRRSRSFSPTVLEFKPMVNGYAPVFMQKM